MNDKIKLIRSISDYIHSKRFCSPGILPIDSFALISHLKTDRDFDVCSFSLTADNKLNCFTCLVSGHNGDYYCRENVEYELTDEICDMILANLTKQYNDYELARLTKEYENNIKELLKSKIIPVEQRFND